MVKSSIDFPLIDQILDAIRAIAGVPVEEEEKFRKILNVQSMRKEEHFLHHGAIPRKIAFVATGLFRYYYVDQNGNEFTKGFFPEGTFITSYTSMVKERPSYYSIQALEDSQLVVFDYHDWQTLYKGHSCWSILLIKILEKGFAKKENRERELLLLSAEERYRSFLNEYEPLEKRLKQHQVASYLGITPVALSRIKRGMLNKK